MNVSDDKVKAAFGKLPPNGQHVVLTMDNSRSTVRTGPLAHTCSDTYELAGTITNKPAWDKDPENFALLVPGSPVPLRIINIYHVQAINGEPTFLKKSRSSRITKFSQTFIIKGSKGASYNVTFDGRFWTCNCPSYQFRRNCRHVSEAKAAYAQNKPE